MKLPIEHRNSILHYLPGLYPAIKIPVPDKAEYYLEQLSKSNQFVRLSEHINDIVNMLETKGTLSEHGLRVTQYKKKILGEFLSVFKENGWSEALNKIDVKNLLYKPLESYITPKYEEGCYISIDIKSANFSVCRYFLGIAEDSWESFCTKYIPDMHEALVKSKSFRQLLFGNLNSKRIQTLASCVTNHYLSAINSILMSGLDMNATIVGISHDEIVLKVTEGDMFGPTIGFLNNIAWIPEVPVKYTCFHAKPISEEGSIARVDTVLHLHQHLATTFDYKRLQGIRADRYHLAFSKYILNKRYFHPLDKEFILDGHKASWDENYY